MKLLGEFATSLLVTNPEKKTPGDGGWDDSERWLLCGLPCYHDIGHGTYSHYF